MQVSFTLKIRKRLHCDSTKSRFDRRVVKTAKDGQRRLKKLKGLLEDVTGLRDGKILVSYGSHSVDRKIDRIDATGKVPETYTLINFSQNIDVLKKFRNGESNPGRHGESVKS